jgi:Mn-dependent DtxR family transcriptional regulator
MMQNNTTRTPLAEMLHLLADGGIHSTAELARRLKVGEGLLAAMVDDLSRRGYLAAMDQPCGVTCDGCGIRAACAAPGTTPAASRLLALTDRGRRAASASG